MFFLNCQNIFEYSFRELGMINFFQLCCKNPIQNFLIVLLKLNTIIKATKINFA